MEFFHVIEPGSFDDHASGIFHGYSCRGPGVFIDQAHFPKQVLFAQLADKKPVALGVFSVDPDLAGFNDIGAVAGLAFQKDDFIFIKSYKVMIHDDLTFSRGHCQCVIAPGFLAFQFILQHLCGLTQSLR